VVVRDELKGIRHALDEVVLFDICHSFWLNRVRFNLF